MKRIKRSERVGLLAAPLAVLFIGLLAVAVRPSQAAVGELVFTIEAPSVQTSQVTCTGGQSVEDFDSVSSGAYGVYVSSIGQYDKGGADFVIQAADQFGGAGGTGNYIRTSIEDSYTLTLAQPAGYFGFWWSAGDGNNRVVVKMADGTSQTFSTQTILDSGAVQGSSGTGTTNGHYGNPNASFIDQSTDELFAYVNIFATNPAAKIVSLEFEEIVGTTGAFESDNHTVCPDILDPGTGTPIPQTGSITIAKVATPADGTAFPFTINYSNTQFELSDGQSGTLNDVPAGTYTAAELVPSGWRLDAIECDDDDSTVSLATASATIRLSGNEDVTCTFYNSQKATLIIRKSATPQDGTNFPFEIDPDARDMIYREIFPFGATYGSNPGPRQNALDEGWRGYWDGMTVDTDPPTDNTGLQIFSPGSTQEVPVNSNPVNTGSGMGFWSPSESRVILYTEEFSFPRGRLDAITYETRHNDADQPQQDFPLLKIDGKWYSPDCQFVNSDVPGNTTWVPAKWSVNNVTWMELDIDPSTNRARVPGQDCAVDNTSFFPPLQTGLAFADLGVTVEAFGLYLPDPESQISGNMRFDNYTLIGEPEGDFVLDDANPDDNDGIIDTQVFETVPGTEYTVKELVPSGWKLDQLDCWTQNGTSRWEMDFGKATVKFNMGANDTVTCTFTNGERIIVNYCPAQDARVGNLQTDFLGVGMGSPTKAVKQRQLVVPDVGDVDSIYGQLAAVDIGVMRFVRFMYQTTTLEKVVAPTSPAYRKWAIDWWGADLDALSPLKGRFVVGVGASRAPRAFVLWPTYQMDESYANVFETFNDSATNHVYWGAGWIPEQTHVITIPETQFDGADITVKVALIDNQPDSRPVVLTVTPLPTGTPVELVLFNPNVPGFGGFKELTLNLEEILLEDVPAGTNEIQLKLLSPGPYDQDFETGPLGGDSVAMIGAAANYPCEGEGEAPITRTLGDRVWYDQNQNGVQDANEPGYNGATVDLYDNATCTGAPIASTTSGSAGTPGSYLFSNVPEGFYCLQFGSIPNGWSISPANQGIDEEKDSDADSSGKIANILLDGDTLAQDMGIYVAGTLGDNVACARSEANRSTNANVPVPLANIGVMLYADFDGNSVPDGAPIATTASDPNGFYQFTGLQVALAGDPNNITKYVIGVDRADPDLGPCRELEAPGTQLGQYYPQLTSDVPSDLLNDFLFSTDFCTTLDVCAVEESNLPTAPAVNKP